MEISLSGCSMGKKCVPPRIISNFFKLQSLLKTFKEAVVLPISATKRTIGTLVPLIIFGVATISVFLKLPLIAR